jgi:hypothetical protein
MASSRKVGLKGLPFIVPGLPGYLMADLSDLGDAGMAADSLFSLMYPNPRSPTCVWGTFDSRLEKGIFRVSVGEWTAVSSAKRGVLGALSEDVEEESLEAVRTGARLRARVRFFPSSIAMWTTIYLLS